MTEKDKNGQARILYLLALAVAVVFLVLLAFNLIGGDLLSTSLGNAASNPVPGVLAFMESFSYPLTYFVWVLLVISVLILLFVGMRSGTGFFEQMARMGIVESGDSHDVIYGLLLGAIMAGVSAFTWFVLSPIPIIPGAVHLRTFAFVPGLVALLFGRGIGFMAGYFGSIFWAVTAGYWILPHTPVIDGVAVGLFTGWIIAAILRGSMNKKELLMHITNNRWMWIVKCALVNLVAGLVMSFFVGASLNVTTAGAVPWWAGFFSIGILSDTIPMVIFTAFFAEPLLRIIVRYPELPDF